MTEIDKVIAKLKNELNDEGAWCCLKPSEVRVLLDHIERSDALLREAERAMLWTPSEYEKVRTDW